MLNEKTITVKMRRIDLCKLLLSTTHLEFDCLNSSKEQGIDERIKEDRERASKMWEKLHDILEEQLNDFDEKHKDDKY